MNLLNEGSYYEFVIRNLKVVMITQKLIGGNLATEVALKNCAPFIKLITKIDGTTRDDAMDLDLVIMMNKLLEHSSNYSNTLGRLWF